MRNGEHEVFLMGFKRISNKKKELKAQLNRIGILITKDAGLNTTLFCVYYYYMYNLFGDNNKDWKRKYFPLDGKELIKFVEEKLKLGEENNKYKNIADEILPVIYPSTDTETEPLTLNRGELKKLKTYGEDYTEEEINALSDDLKNTIKAETKNANFQTLMKKLISILLWKNTIIDSMGRKKNPVNREKYITIEDTLDKVIEELKKEPTFEIEDPKFEELYLDTKNLSDSSSGGWGSDTIYNTRTIYATFPDNSEGDTFYININPERISALALSHMPSVWHFGNSDGNFLKNIKNNMKLSLYNEPVSYDSYYYRDNRYIEDGKVYKMRLRFFEKTINPWDTNTSLESAFRTIRLKDSILAHYTDKYKSSIDKDYEFGFKYHLGWKPDIFLYSKNVKVNNQASTSTSTDRIVLKNGAIDNMNRFKLTNTGNLGLTILVPDLVEKYMKENKDVKKVDLYNRDYSSGDYREQYYREVSNNVQALTELERNRMRGGLTYFLVGIYPVDKDNNILYEDPINFVYFTKNELNSDLGLSFTNYRPINNEKTKNRPYARESFPLKLGQIFYRNNYSQYSRYKDFTVDTNIEYINTLPVGDESKNNLYLYGKDVYMNKIGKYPIHSEDNFNLIEPNDNTNLTTINLENEVEYTFKKYGTTKIAIQLYMGDQTARYIYDKFENFPNYFDFNNAHYKNGKLYGSFCGLPYSYYTKTVYNNMTGINENTNEYYMKESKKVLTNDKITMPAGSNLQYGSLRLENCYCTEPMIIDSEQANINNAAWLDKNNAPYVFRVVTQNDGVDIYPNTLYKDNGKDISFEHWDSGIYIKLPSYLDKYLLGDKDDLLERKKPNKKDKVPKGYSTETPYGSTDTDKKVRVLKNALVGVRINYNPVEVNSSEVNIKNKYRDNTSTILSTDPNDFEIVSYSSGIFLRIKKYLKDLEGLGLGNNRSIKIQLLFRNDFFRSNDPNSPLNYNYVPVTGDVTLLREIAGQRIKLYRGGRLVHPTDYVNIADKTITKVKSDNLGSKGYSFDNTKEVILNRQYTKGILNFSFNDYSMYINNLIDKEGNNYIPELDIADSVYDIISIEMDRPHWEQLLTNNNVHCLNSLETPNNQDNLLFPINIADLENTDMFEYVIEENCHILNNVGASNIKPKINLNNELKYLVFWYIFRPKVSFEPAANGRDLRITIESLEDWKTRIKKENEDFFNKKKVMYPNSDFYYSGNTRKFTDPYNYYSSSSSNTLVDLEDIFAIPLFDSATFSRESSYYGNRDDRFDRLFSSKNSSERDGYMYNILKHIIFKHIAKDSFWIDASKGYVDSNTITITDGLLKKERFGGYIMERLLFHEWYLTHKFGDNPKVDNLLRQSANDTALSLFGMHCMEMFSLYKSKKEAGIYGHGFYVNFNYYISSVFRSILDINIYYLMMNNDYYENVKAYTNIFESPLTGDYEINKNTLVRYNYHASGSSNYYTFTKGKPDSTKGSSMNIIENKIYKGDNGRFNNNSKNIRRGYRMGDKTPDNPFMGFSMSATTEPDRVPDNIHIVYCDIKWSDFESTSTPINNSIKMPGVNNISISKNGLNRYSCTNLKTSYNFTGLAEKFNLNSWANKRKHVVFRLIMDKPDIHSHRDCPTNVLGTEYENELGKGFSPDMNSESVRVQYTTAVLCFIRWLNDNYSSSSGSPLANFIYGIEIGIGHNNSGYNIVNGEKIYIKHIQEIYNTITNLYKKSNVLGSFTTIPFEKIFTSINLKRSYDSTFNDISNWKQYTMVSNLGNKKDFDMWTKYNLVGNTTNNDYVKFINSEGDTESVSDGRYNKFKKGDRFYSGVIRDDLSMEELMKPDNFRDLLYCFKTINPMFVIGYVDKEQYPEQYEMLMNEMGYKVTFTSTEFEDNKIIVNYANEGKNDPSLVFGDRLKLKLKTKGLLNRDNIDTFSFVRQYSFNGTKLGVEMNTNNNFENLGINQGYHKILDTTINGNFNLKRGTNNKNINNIKLSDQYGSKKVCDIYASFVSNIPGIGDFPIKLANVNRTTEINLTDSALLKYFVNPDITKNWYEENIKFNIKMDENGWI